MDAHYYDPDKATLFPETNAILTEYCQGGGGKGGGFRYRPSAISGSLPRRRISLIEHALIEPYYISPSTYVATFKINIFEGQYSRPASPACAWPPEGFRITSSIWMNIRKNYDAWAGCD